MSMDYHATAWGGDRMADMRLCLLILSAWAAGCASPLSSAREAFDEARYPDAVAAFRRASAQLPELEQAELFEYALYRGLTHLALGDSRPAERWLLAAKRLSDATPGLASREQQGRLLAAWSALGHMPGD
jgi:hypothetical protein